jgi:hypothetical protein
MQIMLKEMTTHIRKVTIEVFGVTRENKCEPKNTWWWNDDVQKAINEKKYCYKRLQHNRSDENLDVKKSSGACLLSPLFLHLTKKRIKAHTFITASASLPKKKMKIGFAPLTALEKIQCGMVDNV